MRNVRLQVVGIFVLVGMLLGITSIFAQPVQASASWSLPPIEQPEDPPLCTESVEESVTWLNQYNLTVLDDVQGIGESEGTAFIGGDFNKTGSANFGIHLPSSQSCPLTTLTVVGSFISGNALNIQGGGVQYGGNLNSRPFNFNGSQGCSAVQNSALNATYAAQVTSDMEAFSAHLASFPANNADPVVNGSNNLEYVVSTKTVDGLAVFEVSAAQAFQSGAGGMINLLNNAGATTILINVTGTSVTWQVAQMGTFFQSNEVNVIWNFPEATSLNFSPEFFGALIAPKASLSASNNINGSTVIKTLTTVGEIHLPVFGLSNIPPLEGSCPATPGISIKKYTNDVDADNATGPVVTVGSTVTWTYVVTNTGSVPLSNVSVSDDQAVLPLYQSGDTNSDGKLDVTETWTYMVTGTATAGQYANIGTVTGKSPTNTPVTDTDPSHYFGAEPGIAIKKYTNGEDADVETGPLVAVGSTVTWTYVVTNAGNVPLSNVTVTDDKGVVPVYQDGDTNDDDKLDLDETWTYMVTGTATAGQYENLGTVKGDSPDGKEVDDEDPSHYFGADPAIAIKKYTNGEDADTETGPVVEVGSTVTWTYIVTNSGNVPLRNVTVTDDKGVTPVYQSGDTNVNDLLDLDETWTYQVTGIATAGQYENLGTVTGDSPDGKEVDDEDPSHYFGAEPGIAIKKYTNGEDADTETGPVVEVGSTVTWTYVVTNAGNVPLSNVTVTDDKGVVPVYQNGDANSNGWLDLDETWMFMVTGLATAGQYENLGTVTGKSPDGRDVSDEDPSHYFGSTPTPEVAALGDRVWFDTNANGLQDQGETGVPNITVNLLAGDCTTSLNQSTTTNGQGIYGFSNLTPGSYCVQFALNSLPTGYRVSPQNVGNNDAIDSDGDPVTGKTNSVTLAGGEENLTLDLGIYAPASLGNRVWVDSNENGAQDEGEANVPGVTVTLYNCSNQQVGQPQVTDVNGNYLFTDLMPGCYTVIFDPATLPDEYIFTTQHANGVSPALDSDADVNTGQTQQLTLNSGDEYLDLDAGLVPPAEPEVVLSRLGDTVWYDTNQNGLQDNLNQPGGEQGVPGVEVRLYRSDDTFVKSMLTDSEGKYLFTELQPGNYYVVFAHVTGYSFTHYNVNGPAPDADDSDPVVPWLEVTIDDNGEAAEFDAPLTYTFFYTNTDAIEDAENVVISTTVPFGTSFDAEASNVGWRCNGTGEGSVCTLTLATLAHGTSGAATFTVLVGEEGSGVPETLVVSATITQGTTARTAVVTLGEDDEDLTVDAGIVRIEAGLTTAGPTDPTNLPPGEQPTQRNFVFLPTVQSEQ